MAGLQQEGTLGSFLSSHLEKNTEISTLYKQETKALFDPCLHQCLHIQDATVILKYVHSIWHSVFQMNFPFLNFTLDSETGL